MCFCILIPGFNCVFPTSVILSTEVRRETNSSRLGNLYESVWGISCLYLDCLLRVLNSARQDGRILRAADSQCAWSEGAILILKQVDSNSNSKEGGVANRPRVGQEAEEDGRDSEVLDGLGGDLQRAGEDWHIHGRRWFAKKGAWSGSTNQGPAQNAEGCGSIYKARGNQ